MKEVPDYKMYQLHIYKELTPPPPPDQSLCLKDEHGVDAISLDTLWGS
jgi:hypothetical protein